MGTVTYFQDGQVEQKDQIRQRVVIAQETIDFTKKSALAADVVNVLEIPKGAIVRKIGARVLTAEGATATANLNDAGSNWTNVAVDLNSADSTAISTDANNQAVIYKTASNLTLTLAHDVDAAIIVVFAELAIIEDVADA